MGLCLFGCCPGMISLLWYSDCIYICSYNIHNTYHKAYVGQTSRKLKSRYQEHIRYIKNDPRSAYALHLLNNRHEYGNINDNMTLLIRINKTALLLPYEYLK
jgi:hypothetical protein